MIVKERGSEAISAGVLETIDVGISSRPEDQLMILNILSDTLYTDKISAVWREYGCNGSDANVEAGRGTEPIEISLPTATNPTAVIRDFGFGMSEDQVRNTYCKAGASTKRGSNELIGCLGIGSKAGYAYGPAFTVTSFHKGRKTVYNCFKDNGIPRMAVLQQCDTTERDGVEISVPVRQIDIGDFHERAERVFRYFKVRPKICRGELKFQDNEAILVGQGWKFTGSEHSVAIMGNVGYELQARMLPGDFPPEKRALVEAGVELEFPIGALEIAANREGIQYKDATLKQINHALGGIRAEIATKFTNEIKNAPSLWAATKIYGGMFNRSGNQGMRKIRDAVDGKVMWNGIPLKSGNFYVGVVADRQNGVKIRGARTLEYQRRSYYVRGRLSKYNNPYEVAALDSTTLVWNDNKSGAIPVGKVKYWFEQHSTCQTMLIMTFDDQEAKDDYWAANHMDGAPVIKMTDMPKPPLVPGQSGGVSVHRSKHQARVLALDETATEHVYPQSANWKPIIVDKTVPATYVFISSYQPDDKKIGYRTCTQTRDMLKAARTLGYIGVGAPLLGVKLKYGEPAVKLSDKWISLGERLSIKIEAEFKANPALAQELADYIQADGHQPFVSPKIAGKLVQGCAARTHLEAYAKAKDGKKLESLFRLHKLCGTLFNTSLPKPTINFASDEKPIWSKYPMLQYGRYEFKNSDNQTELQRVIDYINMVELMNLTAQMSRAKVCP
jgi:Histidine kinase-, DNA gyrase B-, and HSP90-like ATPase